MESIWNLNLYIVKGGERPLEITFAKCEIQRVLNNGAVLFDKSKQWRKAFWLLLCAPANVVGKWKQLMLLGAVIGTVFCPIYTFYVSLPYQGALPPQASLVKGFGRVIFKSELQGAKRVGIADFEQEGGPSIRLPDNHVSLPGIKEWTEKHPLESIYVEGFRLRDGRGLFWMSYAATQDGQVLVDRDKRRVTLSRGREQFGTVLWWMYGYVVAPLWLSSFNNIRIVRNSTDPT